MKSSQFAPPHLNIEISDPVLGKLGYLVIDRPVHSSTSGGVRFLMDVSPDELAALARSMTYKWALINTPMGGAKAGICADPQALDCDRTKLMEAFGHAISPLVMQHIYYPGIDMGTTLDDLRAIMRGAGRPLTGEQIDGSRSTALTVFESIRQVATWHEVPLQGLTVAIEGFGKVASHVATQLTQAGATLIAISTVHGALVCDSGLDIAQLLTLKEQHGDQMVYHYPSVLPQPPEVLLGLPVRLLVPGARPWLIREDNLEQVQAQFIIPISNAPITTEAEGLLNARGKIIVPDFLANCGGILSSAMLSNGFHIEDTEWIVETVFAALIANIQTYAKQQNISLGEAARSLAWEQHLSFNGKATTHRSYRQRLVDLWKKDGWAGIQRRLAWRIFQRWPKLGPIHQAALERYAEQTLGVTHNLLLTWLQQENSVSRRSL
jgi:glutamate dehydrogenase (NAD(P)+)